MEKAILIRIGEIFLKGKNRDYFYKVLVKNIKNKLHKYNLEIESSNNRIMITSFNIDDEMYIIEDLKKIFGIHSISPCVKVDSNRESIEEYINTLKINTSTFRVTVNRADKRFEINSTEYSKLLGGIILKNNHKVNVDLHSPETEISVDIRNNGTFIFDEKIPCSNGMPVGTSGNGLLLLSGGIDSPVAGYQMAKRGMCLSALHFHSYPYTSVQAREKVIELAKIVSDYTGNIRLYIVSFKKVQEAIHEYCNEEYMITIMRRIMMRIAEIICKQNGLQTIITGESLGQVASQTIESMTVVNKVVENLPVLRPLVAMDKEEIVTIAKKINTFNTSILPYEDCCTVFLPNNPIIKPKLEKVLIEESKLDIDKLVSEALETLEILDTNSI